MIERWFVGLDSSDSEMVARRDIEPGEEVTFDYATCESTVEAFRMDCKCGSKECRGVVRYRLFFCARTHHTLVVVLLQARQLAIFSQWR